MFAAPRFSSSAPPCGRLTVGGDRPGLRAVAEHSLEDVSKSYERLASLPIEPPGRKEESATTERAEPKRVCGALASAVLCGGVGVAQPRGTPFECVHFARRHRG